jgi:hypothetical protein
MIIGDQGAAKGGVGLVLGEDCERKERAAAAAMKQSENRLQRTHHPIVSNEYAGGASTAYGGGDDPIPANPNTNPPAHEYAVMPSGVCSSHHYSTHQH